MFSKVCRECKRLKKATEFSFSARSKDNLYDTCKQCWREYIASRNLPPEDREVVELAEQVSQALDFFKEMTWFKLCTLVLPKNTVRWKRILDLALKRLGAERSIGTEGVVYRLPS